MCGSGRGLPGRSLDRENTRFCKPERMGDQESTDEKQGNTRERKETQGSARKHKETRADVSLDASGMKKRRGYVS